ncbi:MAG TPA: metal-dependent hydrolase [Steroidobacteraceae bacterium]|nr:metal-dependent hydrolase [Steroidobacteraceae bacterium]
MDNITHTLIGVIAGEAVARCTRSPGTAGHGDGDGDGDGLPDTTRRSLLMTMGAVGGNLPDMDLLWSYGGEPANLGYLLQHRGHTHTVIGCAVLALLLYAVVLAWMRIRRLAPSRDDRLLLAGMALLSLFLHLGMDALNSYGVHPYWPFYNGWLYGDAVFIVEPLYWLAAAPLLFVLRTWLARIALGLWVLIAVAAGVLLHRSDPGWAAGIVLLAVALGATGKLRSPRVAALTSVAMLVLTTLLFVTAGLGASRRVEAIAAQSFPGDKTLDQVLSPAPMNPLCWDVLLVQTGGGRYVVRHGQLALGPAPRPDSCPRVLSGAGSTAPMTAVRAVPSADMLWLGEFSMPVGRLASLARRDCVAYELLQFARAPFATEVERRWIVGDLRFDREPGLGMAEIRLAEVTLGDVPAARCGYSVPWIPPRSSLLSVVE